MTRKTRNMTARDARQKRHDDAINDIYIYTNINNILINNYPYFQIRKAILPIKKCIIVFVSCAIYEPNDCPTITFHLPPFCLSIMMMMMMMMMMIMMIMMILMMTMR